MQCLVRKRSAKVEYRKRKKEKDNVDALQAKIKAYEVRRRLFLWRGKGGGIEWGLFYCVFVSLIPGNAIPLFRYTFLSFPVFPLRFVSSLVYFPLFCLRFLSFSSLFLSVFFEMFLVFLSF